MQSTSDAIIAEANSEGISRFVVNATCETDWPAVEALSQRHPHCVLPSFGVHPYAVRSAKAGWESRLRSLLLAHPAAAVGECGLHRGRGPRGSAAGAELSLQREALRTQLRLAFELKRPASIHCVGAYGALLEDLRACCNDSAGGGDDDGSGDGSGGGLGRGSGSNTAPRLLLHSRTGHQEMVPAFAALGAFFSISGAATRRPRAAIAAAIAAIPQGRLLLETDSPDALPRALDLSATCNGVQGGGGGGGEGDADGDSHEAEEGNATVEPRRMVGGSESADDGGCSCCANNEGGPLSLLRCRRLAAPAPQLNHPKNLRAVLAFVAEVRGEEESEVAAYTTRNAEIFFRFDRHPCRGTGEDA